MIEATDLGSVGSILGGLATFVVLIVIPLSLLFHRRVIKPLSWVLGLKADESPTGEEVLPVPRQLAELRKGQLSAKADHDDLVKTVAVMQTQQKETAQLIGLIKAEVFPNHGGSMRDAIDHTNGIVEAVRADVIDLRHTMDAHLIEARADHAELQAHIMQGDK